MTTESVVGEDLYEAPPSQSAKLLNLVPLIQYSRIIVSAHGNASDTNIGDGIDLIADCHVFLSRIDATKARDLKTEPFHNFATLSRPWRETRNAAGKLGGYSTPVSFCLNLILPTYDDPALCLCQNNGSWVPKIKGEHFLFSGAADVKQFACPLFDALRPASLTPNDSGHRILAFYENAAPQCFEEDVGALILMKFFPMNFVVNSVDSSS
ncbi:hypothetical protein [Rhizobium sp. P32RR-XVIII]|uniref:hypothetical protein n=1 Tax=Rhizobium sp. P32RR-XVIII TaxID=2726738 RepID=UPI001FED416A|nr:hypothetical protein [Rhizobium sp. P32RR-XVIII]